MESSHILMELPGLLLPWYRCNARVLPWRADRAPYHVWLSEIMLQQTRVEAVKPYYLRFLQKFPTLQDLARCDDETLLKLWEGLGYYSRARNLKRAAQVIVEQYGGVFPSDYLTLLSLPGVGEYTAGAVASICYDLPEPAVDGNVLRVVTRLCADGRCIDDTAVRREIRDRLREVYLIQAKQESCAALTQALMELGATVCIPNGAPHCEQCPCREICLSRQQNTVSDYPVRKQKKARKIEQYTVYILRCGNRIALRKRPQQGLLAGLWELPNTEGSAEIQEALKTAEQWGCQPMEAVSMTRRVHIFTHIEWHMNCAYLLCGNCADGFTWVTCGSLAEEMALPTAFRIALPDSVAAVR